MQASGIAIRFLWQVSYMDWIIYVVRFFKTVDGKWGLVRPEGLSQEEIRFETNGGESKMNHVYIYICRRS